MEVLHESYWCMPITAPTTTFWISWSFWGVFKGSPNLLCCSNQAMRWLGNEWLSARALQSRKDAMGVPDKSCANIFLATGAPARVCTVKIHNCLRTNRKSVCCKQFICCSMSKPRLLSVQLAHSHCLSVIRSSTRQGAHNLPVDQLSVLCILFDSGKTDVFTVWNL